MGSLFAGVKAGILAGVFYAGIIGVFNLLLINIFRGQILGALSAYSECSGPAATSTPDVCFAAISSIYLPYVVFMIFLFSLVFASIFGAFFELIPQKRYALKALMISLILYISLFMTSLTGVPFDIPSYITVSIFDLAMTVVYALLLARFYRRYTRAVSFSSQDPGMLRVILDRRDVTGKTRTMAVGSSHKLRASTKGETHFREWSFSGGVTVEDSRSFYTEMRVGGDGMLKASGGWGSGLDTASLVDEGTLTKGREDK